MLQNNSKLVVVTRQDLSPGLQAVQSAHSAIDFLFKHPELAKEWHTVSNYLIFVSAKDEKELEFLSEKCKLKKVIHTVFRESDLENQITAICLEPSEQTQKLISSFPLTLKIKK